MAESLKLSVEHLDEFDIAELKQRLTDSGLDANSIVALEKPDALPGEYGVPGEYRVLIEVALATLPVIASVLALWAAKGRASARATSTKFGWTKDGITYEQVDLEKSSESDNSDEIEKALTASAQSVLGS